MTVLNPLRRVEEHIMDDADLAGPVFYCFCFGICLLLVRKNNSTYPLPNSCRSPENQISIIFTALRFLVPPRCIPS